MPAASVFPVRSNANLAARPSLRSAHARQESRLHRRGCTDTGAWDWRQCRDFQCSELAASASAGISHAERLAAIRVRYEKLNLKNIVASAPATLLCATTERSSHRQRCRRTGASTTREAIGRCGCAGREYLAVFTYLTPSHYWVVFSPQKRPTWRQPRGRALLQRVEVHLRRRREHRGRSIQLNQEPYRIIGVMGPDFLWPNPTDLWAPLGLKPEDFAIDNLFNESYFVVARLQPNVKLADATAYLTS